MPESIGANLEDAGMQIQTLDTCIGDLRLLEDEGSRYYHMGTSNGKYLGVLHNISLLCSTHTELLRNNPQDINLVNQVFIREYERGSIIISSIEEETQRNRRVASFIYDVNVIALEGDILSGSEKYYSFMGMEMAASWMRNSYRKGSREWQEWQRKIKSIPMK